MRPRHSDVWNVHVYLWTLVIVKLSGEKGRRVCYLWFLAIKLGNDFAALGEELVDCSFLNQHVVGRNALLAGIHVAAPELVGKEADRNQPQRRLHWKQQHGQRTQPAQLTVRRAARAMSASFAMNTGFLPPSSRVTGVR